LHFQTSNNMYKYIVLAVLIVAISCAPKAKKRNQNECADRTVYENCIQSLFMFGPGKQFPNSTEQITTFCGKLKETDVCVKEYTKKCLTPTGRRATEVAIAGISRLAKRMCKSPRKQEEFIKNAKCGNAVIGDMRSCLKSYKLSLYGAKQVKVTEKLPILCCKFYDFRGCVRNGFQKVGEEVCPEPSQMFFSKIADAFQSDVFDLICSEYDDGSNKCANVVVPEVKDSPNTKSLFAPLKDIIKSILENQE